MSPSTSTQTPATNLLQRCHRGLCGWRNSTQTSFGPHQRAWPPKGGRGAERRGDIIRAAPPPAATPLPSPGEASMTSSASSPTPGTLAAGRAPSPASLRLEAVRDAAGMVTRGRTWRATPAGLYHLLTDSESGAEAQTPATAAPLSGAARSPPRWARGAARLCSWPLPPRARPAHQRLRQTRARPPNHAPRNRQSWTGAGLVALTPLVAERGPVCPTGWVAQLLSLSPF